VILESFKKISSYKRGQRSNPNTDFVHIELKCFQQRGGSLQSDPASDL